VLLQSFFPCPGDVVYHHLTGHAPLVSKRREWWLQDRGGAYWWAAKTWCSFVPEFFFGRGLGEIPVGLSDSRGAAFEWHHSFLEGHRGKPPSTSLRAGENPRTIWSGQQRHVDGVSLLEGVAWF
jgi:hypothetical protein